jgi:hypothetical protein
MRYYNTEPTLHNKEWFIFMDDDIYYRPFALKAMLHALTAQFEGTSTKQPMALVASNRYRSFQFSKGGPKESTSGNTKPTPHNCKGSSAYDFAIAQPAMLNR